LKKGYKKITPEELYERFACEKTTYSLNKKRIDEEIENIKCSNNGITIKNIELMHREIQHQTQWYYLISYIRSGWLSIFDTVELVIVEIDHRCRVEIESLKDYMETDIPDRVLETVVAIKKLCGDIKFAVAYPIVEKLPQIKPPDPVLLAKFGEKYIELDMWE